MTNKKNMAQRNAKPIGIFDKEYCDWISGLSLNCRQLPTIPKCRTYILNCSFVSSRSTDILSLRSESPSSITYTSASWLGIIAMLDDLLDMSHDNLSIGLLICKEKNNVLACYTLLVSMSPFGISLYKLSL